jgi:hypothetical protein
MLCRCGIYDFKCAGVVHFDVIEFYLHWELSIFYLLCLVVDEVDCIIHADILGLSISPGLFHDLEGSAEGRCHGPFVGGKISIARRKGEPVRRVTDGRDYVKVVSVRMGEEEILTEAAQDKGLLDVLLAKVCICRLSHPGVKIVVLERSVERLTSTALKSLRTTVATPLKKVGRLLPSI